MPQYHHRTSKCFAKQKTIWWTAIPPYTEGWYFWQIQMTSLTQSQDTPTTHLTTHQVWIHPAVAAIALALYSQDLPLILQLRLTSTLQCRHVYFCIYPVTDDLLHICPNNLTPDYNHAAVPHNITNKMNLAPEPNHPPATNYRSTTMQYSKPLWSNHPK